MRVTFKTEEAFRAAKQHKEIYLFSFNCSILGGGPPATPVHIFDFPYEEEDTPIKLALSSHGHVSGNCPDKDKCRRCGSTGHFARDCHSSSWGSAPPTVPPAASSSVFDLEFPPPAPVAVVSDPPPPSNVNDEQRVDADQDSLADVGLSHVNDPSASSSESGSDTSDKDSTAEDNDISVGVAPVERLSDSEVSSSSRKRNHTSDIEDFTSSISSKVGRVECNDSAAETAVECDPPFEDLNPVVSPSVEPAEMPDSNPASNVSPGAVSATSSLLEDAQRSEESPSVL